MKIYDISQEIFECKVFPGDPVPQKENVLKISDGDICNLSAFYMCAHNGTHVDAPNHFYDTGKTIDQIVLDRFIGKCYVTDEQGAISANDAERIIENALKMDKDASKRILIKGNAYVTEEAAEVFAQQEIFLLGNESQTVGPEDAPMAVHLILLKAEVVLLEGIRLDEIKEGIYFLNAAPINLGKTDGAPCRAVLVEV